MLFSSSSSSSRLVSRGGGGGGSGKGPPSFEGRVEIGGGVGGGGVKLCRRCLCLEMLLGEPGGDGNLGLTRPFPVGVVTLEEDVLILEDLDTDLEGVLGGGVAFSPRRCGFFGGRSGGVRVCFRGAGGLLWRRYCCLCSCFCSTSCSCCL